MTDVYLPYKLNRLNSSIKSQCEPPKGKNKRWIISKNKTHKKATITVKPQQ